MATLETKRLYLSPPHMGGHELAFVEEAFQSNYIAPLGPMVDAFEREFAHYIGITHCLAVASGTAAMHLALRELGIGPGDLVIAATLTFIGGVSPAYFQGANLTFIDSERTSWCMDPDLLAEELEICAKNGSLPKAVISTDIYGQCADLNRIRAACAPYGIRVVSDSAEAVGAHYQYKTTWSPNIAIRTKNAGQEVELRPNGPETSSWKHAGFGADTAVFSFNGNKIITTSGGGILASEDPFLIKHAQKLSQQARDPAPYYQHSEIGYNYRMSNVVAAIGRGQLAVLEQRLSAKRRIFDGYQHLLTDLPGLEFMPEAPYGLSNRWLTVVLIQPKLFGATNEQVRLALEAQNIESRPVWKPMHLQPVFAGCHVRRGEVSELLFQTGLCLPSGTAMSDSDLERVAGIIRQCSRPRPARHARVRAVQCNRNQAQPTMQPRSHWL